MLTAQVNKLFRKYQSSVMLRSGVWYLIGRFGLKGMSFLGVLLFSRLLLPDQFGTASIFFAWVAVLYIVATLFIESSILRARFDYEDQPYRQFLSSVLALGLLLSVGALMLALLLPESLLISVIGLPRPLVLLAVLHLPALLAMNITLRRWEAQSNYRQNVALMVLVEFGELLLSALLIVVPPLLISTYPIEIGRILGYAVIYLLVGGWCLWRLLREGRVLINTTYWRYALALSVPLIPHALSQIMLSQFDRIMIDQYIGRDEAGIYSFAYQLGTLVFVIWTATNTAWAPWFYKHMKEERYAIIRHRIPQYIAGFTAVTLLMILTSPLVVPLIAPAAYQGAIRIVPVIMGGGFFVFLYSLYANVEFHEKKTWYVAVNTILAALINVILNLIFIPRDGYLAAGWTTLVAYICLWLAHAGVVRFRLKSPNVNNFALSTLMGTMVVAATLLVYFLTG
jgi:O-antigen/teichoic acid export membrane protein